MKILFITLLFIFLMTSTVFSLPSYNNIANSKSENLNISNGDSNNIANEILNINTDNKDSRSIQMAAGSGSSSEPSYTRGTYNPDINQPTYVNNRPVEYTGGHVIPEPLTIILLGLGLTGLAIRKNYK